MKKERDYYFDNFRAFLIVMVVIGHYFGPIAKQYEIIACIQKVIFLFHMPAFVFISGYFSKKNDWTKLVKTLLIPYLALQIIFYFLYNYIWGVPKEFSLLTPGYTLWFLLCLFVWRILVTKVAKIKGIIPILFCIGILAGFSTEIGKMLSLSRMITFFPYFLLGYQFDKEKFMKWADHKFSYFFAGIILTAITIWMVFHHSQIRIKLLESCCSYASLHLQDGWIQRGVLYMVSTIMIYALAVLIPKKKHAFSYLGSRTMGIYMIHGAIFKTIVNCTNWYDHLKTPVGLITLMLFSLAICLILSTKVVDCAVRVLASVPFEYLINENEPAKQHRIGDKHGKGHDERETVATYLTVFRPFIFR